jgi:HlyD family secretion protein
MQRKSMRYGLIGLLALGLALSGCSAMGSSGSSSLSASGVVETVEIAVAPELAGRVAEVYVAEGDAVQAEDPLLRLDGEMYLVQRKLAVTSLELAEAELDSARTGLDMAQASLQAAETGVDVAAATTEAKLLPAEQDLKSLYDNADVTKAAASKAVADANRALREAQYQLDNFTIPTDQQDLTPMQAVDVMRAHLDEARNAFKPYKYLSSGNSTRERLKDDLDEAQSDYDAAVRRLEYVTAVGQAHAALDKAKQDLEKVQNGPNPDAVAALEARIAAIKVAPKEAQAALDQAHGGVKQAQTRLDQADKGVQQAQANLELLDTQIEKLIIKAPAEGVVMVRSVEPGEVVQPGFTVLTLGQLNDLTIKVYIPEDLYGKINLGDKAQVSSDSFPNQTFEAVVVSIADQAEYTPRNVQTKNDRATTVFAIKLSIANPEGKLKPGMPVDVQF